MTGLALYQLSAGFRDAADRLADTDLDEATIADTLESLQYPIEQKAVQVAFALRNLEAAAEQIKAAEKAMAERRKALEKRAERVNAYLLANMELCGISKIDSPYFCISVRENNPAVVIDDAGEIPCDLYVYPEAPAPYPDKRAIAERIKSGQVVNGAHLERGKSLVIR